MQKKFFYLKFKVKINSTADSFYVYFHQIEGVEFTYDSHEQTILSTV